MPSGSRRRKQEELGPAGSEKDSVAVAAVAAPEPVKSQAKTPKQMEELETAAQGHTLSGEERQGLNTFLLANRKDKALRYHQILREANDFANTNVEELYPRTCAETSPRSCGLCRQVRGDLETHPYPQ